MVTEPLPRLAVVLPSREGFAPDQAGAISLTVRDLALNSALRERTTVMGLAVDSPFPDVAFAAVTPAKAWWRKRSAAYGEGCLQLLRRDPPTDVDVHNRLEVFLRLAKGLRQTRVNLWLHNDPLTMRGCQKPKQRRTILRRAHRVICVSEFLRQRFLNGIDDPRGQVVVIPNPIDTERNRPADKQPLILFVGRIVEEKGAQLFARAVARALPELPGWRVRVIGSDRPGQNALEKPYEHEFAQLLAPLGERAEHWPFVPHDVVMRSYAEAAVAVVPSIWPEPFGRTALEAMVAGCAVITTGRGGLGEVTGGTALAFDGSEEALVDALLQVCRDDTLRAQLAAAGRQRAEQTYSVQAVARRLDALRG